MGLSVVVDHMCFVGEHIGNVARLYRALVPDSFDPLPPKVNWSRMNSVTTWVGTYREPYHPS